MASAYGLPDNLWIFIIIMAIIILALLWRDKLSEGSSSSSSSTSTTTTRDDPPSVNMSLSSASSKKKGETFKLRGRYDSGDGSISSKTLKMNGTSISGKISSWSGGRFTTKPITVPDTNNVKCKVGVRTRYGSDEDTVSFTPVDQGGGEDEGPTLNVDVKTTDTGKNDSTGSVKITASPTAGDAPIKVTVVDAGSVGQEENRGAGNCVFQKGGLPAGEYPYRAATEDQNDNTQDVEDTFKIEEKEPGPGGDTGDGTGGGGFGGGIINNNQNEIINEFNVPPEVVKLLKNIVDQTGDKGDGDVTQEVNMGGYQLLMAMHMLQNDLDSGDNQQIVNELQQINTSLETNQISADELENSLRTVLHQVFDMDIEDMFGDMGVDVSADNNFDSDKIVQAINSSSTDIGPILNRLSNIENAVNQLQNQGNGDLGNIEVKLDQIVNAVNSSGMDQQMMQTFISEIGDLQSKGVDVDIGDIGNNNGADVDNLMMMRLMDDVRHRDNPDREMERILEVIREQGRLNREILQELVEEEEQDSGSRNPVPYAVDGDPAYVGGPSNKNGNPVNNGMPNDIEGIHHELDTDIEKEINHLQDEYENMETMIQEEGEIEDLEKRMDHEIEELVKHLKKARQVEHHLVELFMDSSGTGDQDFADELNHNIHQLHAQIKEAKSVMDSFTDDFESFKSKLEQRRSVFQSVGKVEEQLQQQEDQLEKTEQMMENAVDRLVQNGDVKKGDYS